MPERPRLSSEFWRFWSAAALSNLGDGIRLTALPLLAVRLTDSAVAISAVTAMIGVPWLLFGAVGGTIVDRLDRRRLMIAGQVGRGLAVAALAIWVAVATPPLAAVYAATLLVGIGEVIVDSASQAAVPMLAPPGDAGLELANGRLVGAQTVFDQLIGAPVGAALFAVGAAIPFAVDAGTFLVAALLLGLVSTPLQPERTGPATSMRADITEGFSILWRSDLLRGLAVAIGLLNVILSASMAVLVIFVVDELGGSEQAFGVVLGVGAGGGVAGALLAGRVVERVGRRATLVATTAVSAAVIAVVSAAPNVAVLTAGFAIVLAIVTVGNVTGQSLRQAVAPPHALGRVVASYRIIGLAGVPIGALTGGILVDATDVRTTFLIAGLAGIVPVTAMVAALRHLDE